MVLLVELPANILIRIFYKLFDKDKQQLLIVNKKLLKILRSAYIPLNAVVLRPSTAERLLITLANRLLPKLTLNQKSMSIVFARNQKHILPKQLSLINVHDVDLPYKARRMLESLTLYNCTISPRVNYANLQELAICTALNNKRLGKQSSVPSKLLMLPKLKRFYSNVPLDCARIPKMSNTLSVVICILKKQNGSIPYHKITLISDNLNLDDILFLDKYQSARNFS